METIILPWSSSSNIFRKAFYIRLIEHINNTNVLVGQQIGFRKRLSTKGAFFFLVPYFN